MIKIAFDLDGVFLPDCDTIPWLGGLEEFYTLTSYMCPVFVPSGDYSIITARKPEFKHITETWIKKYFPLAPLKLYHDVSDETPGQYKARILNESDIDIYVESDSGIVEYLRKHTNKQICHFSEFAGDLTNYI